MAAARLSGQPVSGQEKVPLHWVMVGLTTLTPDGQDTVAPGRKTTTASKPPLPLPKFAKYALPSLSYTR